MKVSQKFNDQCFICDGSGFSFYPYGNHFRKYCRVRCLKHFGAHVLFPLLQSYSPNLSNYYPRLERLYLKSLFSPFSSIKRCDKCGYAYYDKNITSTQLREYYEIAYWQSCGDIKNKYLLHNDSVKDSRAAGQYHFVSEVIKELGSIRMLEIGAGPAHMSRLMRSLIVDVGTDVIEPSNVWLSHYKRYHINVVSRYFPLKTSNKYNYIHSSHSLEHIYDLKEAMVCFGNLIKQRGFLFIEVPNCDSDYYRLDFGDTPHIHFFTKKALQMLFEKRGFKCVKIDEIGLTNREEIQRRKKPNNFDKNIKESGQLSELENMPREGGERIRGLFQLI